MNNEKSLKIDRFTKLLNRFMKKAEDQIIINDILQTLENCTTTNFLVSEINTAIENIYINSNNIYEVLRDLKTNLGGDNARINVNGDYGDTKENNRHKLPEVCVTLIEGDSVLMEDDSTFQINMDENFDEIKEGIDMKKNSFLSGSRNDNISLSSDDNENEFLPVQNERDSDVEIINDNVNGDEQSRTHHDQRYQFNINHDNQRYTNLDDVIQIDDSSDEDVQEIKINSNGSFTNQRYQNNNNKRRKRKHSCSNDSRHSENSSLANLPFIIQFPTMQNAAFNGTLYVSHNHKFSVKLQGVDPSHFQFNSHYS